MNIIKGSYNRIRFIWTKHLLKECGNQVLFESPFEVEGANCVSIGDNVRAKPRLHLAAITNHNGEKFNPSIIIGNNVSINYDVHIACSNRIEIGEGTLIASKVFITDHFHGDTTFESLTTPPSQRILVSKGPVIIGKNVWIGEGAVIMPGLTIGDHCVIGANAVVTKSIQAYSVVCGVPARVIKNVETE